MYTQNVSFGQAERDSKLVGILDSGWPNLDEHGRFELVSRVLTELGGRKFVHKFSESSGSDGYRATETLRQVVRFLLVHPRRCGVQKVFCDLVKKVIVNCKVGETFYSTGPQTIYLYQTPLLLDWPDELTALETVRMVASVMFDGATADQRYGFEDPYACYGALTEEGNVKDEATLFLARVYLYDEGCSIWNKTFAADRQKPQEQRTSSLRISWAKRLWRAHGVQIN